jgi:protein phosphatase
MSVRAGMTAPRSTFPVAAPAGAATAVGHRRRHNEDAVLCGPHWFVVADGMGGHLAGDVASAVAVAEFASRTTPPISVDEIHRAVTSANVAVSSRAHADGTVGMGTTIVGATVVGPADSASVAVFHVGDSRCYRLLDGELALLTTDHSHVQELVDSGRITASDTASHPLRNVVTRALGQHADIAADIITIDRPGRLLLCSDGLSSELDARSIGRVLAGVGHPQVAADRLVELALAGAARDNVTALVVDFDLAAATR